MKTLFKFAFAVALTATLVKAFLRRVEARRNEPASKGTAPGSSAEYAVPTLHAVQDADAQRPEPLLEDDLNVAQNAPL